MISAGQPEQKHIVSGASGRTHPQGSGRTPSGPWRPILQGGGGQGLNSNHRGEGEQGSGRPHMVGVVLSAHIRK